jgi:predicted RNA-binding protein with PUA-like domain
MAYFLAKTDPETYSIDDLERERTTVWDGVRNPQAVKAIQQMLPGDQALIYHSMGRAAIVGIAEIISAPRADPRDPRSAVIDLRFVKKLAQPITLREIKETRQFDDWILIRQGRLSTMAVPEAFVIWLRSRGVL